MKREKPKVTKKAKKRAESHLSAVSMKAQSDGLQSGTFLDTLEMFSERERVSGNTVLGSSRSACESGAQTPQLVRVFGCPVRIY